MKEVVSRNKWLLPAIAAAVVLTNPFMAVAAGLTSTLLFFYCDRRLSYRRIAGLALIPMVFLSLLISPLLAFFAAAASFLGVWVLRKNFFSTVTSSALAGCLLALVLSLPLILGSGAESWLEIEKSTIAVQEKWQQMAVGDEEEPGSERVQAAKDFSRMAVRLLPGQFMLMMVIGFFLSVILFRNYGLSRMPLSLGGEHFNQYRFEDNWVWTVILGLALVLIFSSREWVVNLSLNIFFVMGILYVIRGLAVAFYFIELNNGGVILRILLVVLCLTPVVFFYLMFGLLDTWLDFRKRVPAGGK